MSGADVPKCPRCRVGGFKRCAGQFDRPRFICTRCDHEWTCGIDGGVYAAYKADRAALRTTEGREG